MATKHTIGDALSDLLDTLGFSAMARDAKTETDWNTLCRYARIILNATRGHQMQAPIRQRLIALGLIAF